MKRDYLPFDSPDEPGVMLVPLTQNKYAKIDAEDYELVAAHKWFATCPVSKPGREVFYAMTQLKGAPRRMIYLHRFIMGEPGGLEIDHEDGDTLNCTRTNLREATRGQNGSNRRAKVNGTSRFLGVSWNSRDGVWQVSITSNYKNKYLGNFADEIAAAKAYDDAARELHGEFARLNIR